MSQRSDLFDQLSGDPFPYLAEFTGSMPWFSEQNEVRVADTFQQRLQVSRLNVAERLTAGGHQLSQRVIRRDHSDRQFVRKIQQRDPRRRLLPSPLLQSVEQIARLQCPLS